MEVLRRDVGICIAAVLILATILLPGLLLRGPEASTTEAPRAAGLRAPQQRPLGRPQVTAKESLSEPRVPARPSDALVRDPVHPTEGLAGDFWVRDARDRLAREAGRREVVGKAKNIIFFLGDGMGVSTLTAARVHKGQRDAGLVGGEQEMLLFERFPHLALVRTYCHDTTVADSACSATSYLCGVKANYQTVGVTAAVPAGDCEAQKVAANQATSLLAWAQAQGKATGLVTTDSLTGASPAGAFAHSSHRDWENDRETPAGCEDIASQLVTGATGRGLRVVLGGGRAHLQGRRDARDLLQEWRADKQGQGVLVTSGTELAMVNASDTEYLFGVFAEDEMRYRLDLEETVDEPTLAEMTAKALEVLGKSEEGFVLFVESALVDKAHHEGWARRSLEEVLQLEAAVEVALNMTSSEETLTVVTADHSHSFTLSGYANRGTDILGFDPLEPSYLSLMYGTGPGGARPEGWSPPGEPRLAAGDFRYPAAAYRDSAAHQGEEVALYATGPGAHLFRGLLQQHYIPHTLAYAACICLPHYPTCPTYCNQP